MIKYLLVFMLMCGTAYGGVFDVMRAGAKGVTVVDSGGYVEQDSSTPINDADSYFGRSSNPSVAFKAFNFTTNASGYDCTKVMVSLCMTGTTSSPTMTLRLYDDNAGNPGVVIAESAVFTVNTIITTACNAAGAGEEVEFTLSATTLSASTQYWICVRGWNDGTLNYPRLTYNTSGTGVTIKGGGSSGADYPDWTNVDTTVTPYFKTYSGTP